MTWTYSNGRLDNPSLCHDGQMSPQELARTRIIGVYNARGTVLGELNYLLRRTFAGEHCALCDITHGSVRRRPAWDRCAESFSTAHAVDIELVHLDEVPVELGQIADFTAPAVFVHKPDGTYELLLGDEELQSCHHAPEQFFIMLEQKIGSIS